MADEFADTLSPAEIYNLTHYRRQSEQLRALEKLGIPAQRRHDNTICVLRVHLKQPPAMQEPQRPRLRL